MRLMLLPSNTRKTECGASLLLVRLVVRAAPFALLLATPLLAQEASAQEVDLTRELLAIKRVYVDRLTGGETAAQMRDLIIGSLQSAKLFVITENADRG